MTNIGLGIGYLAVSVLYIAIPLAWLILVFVCLNRLKSIPLQPTTKAVWVLIIAAIPIIGAIAFFIIKPTEEEPKKLE